MTCCPPSPVRNTGSCDEFLSFPDPTVCTGCNQICAGDPVGRVDNATTYTDIVKTAWEYTTGERALFATEYAGVALDNIECDPCQVPPTCLQVVKTDCEFKMEVSLVANTQFNKGAMLTLAEDPDNAGQLTPRLYEVTANAAEALFVTAEASGVAGKQHKVLVTGRG